MFSFKIILSFLVFLKCNSETLRPNIIIFLTDDLGYGDLPNFGHPTSKTPNLEKLAKNSKVFTDFYAASPVCSPSRASLLTGLYTVSTGVWPGVFFPEAVGGMSNLNMAEILESNYGYQTAIVGKWHLGHGINGTYLPTNHGFSQYFGIPYSHDMCQCKTCFPDQGPCSDLCNPNYVSCPLFKDDVIIEQPADLTNLNERYTEVATNFLTETMTNEEGPFFLYMAYHQPHHPQFAGSEFHSQSDRGNVGDSLLEMDDSLGKILETVKMLNQLNNTIVIFTSDNGPSLMRHDQGGCAGLLRCGKATTWEGGMRVPAFISWPGFIESGKVRDLASTIDILPTILSLIGGDPTSIETHGYDLKHLLLENQKSPRENFLYFPMEHLNDTGPMAMRYLNYKAHFYTEGNDLSDGMNYDLACRGSEKLKKHDPPILFNLLTDPGERYPLDLDLNPELQLIIKDILAAKAQVESRIVWKESEMKKGTDRMASPCCSGQPNCEPFPSCCDCNFNHITIDIY